MMMSSLIIFLVKGNDEYRQLKSDFWICIYVPIRFQLSNKGCASNLSAAKENLHMQSYQQHIMHETGQKRTIPAFSKTRKRNKSMFSQKRNQAVKNVLLTDHFLQMVKSCLATTLSLTRPPDVKTPAFSKARRTFFCTYQFM